ncbi:uncharacterized protein B0I36DRAFT_341764 [Microdochium trichocladiopsis]|uniref:Uncharacterized protein n=1 Tax=Microdochium trichocladiopsis TaxID=1682393 RepID=A0A9P8XRH3_9PEZI|nr:uncharacterized protein B0I36DRAFT_341764 [Microdochium trichocladiopsis]KAH7010612.1 hypothetical protein B0I36DRAFT_341764 [Microdochium trichocladiopsis]
MFDSCTDATFEEDYADDDDEPFYDIIQLDDIHSEQGSNPAWLAVKHVLQNTEKQVLDLVQKYQQELDTMKISFEFEHLEKELHIKRDFRFNKSILLENLRGRLRQLGVARTGYVTTLFGPIQPKKQWIVQETDRHLYSAEEIKYIQDMARNERWKAEMGYY